jgi:hypothetical protein
MLRKLLKAVAWLLAVLVVAGFLFVWQGLGVLPLEAAQDHLWELVSNDVEFYASGPGADVLGEPVVEGLGEEEGFEALGRLREEFARALADAAREVNPRIPLGLVTVDLEKDLRGKEVALAGVIRSDVARMSLDNFVLLARIPGYAKFVSALARDFVRSRVPMGDRVSVVKGSYFRLELDAQMKAILARFRSPIERADPDAIWFARIRDVLVISDEPIWIEHALLGGGSTLPGDVDFKTEFMGVRRGDVELYVKGELARRVIERHGGRDGGLLFYPSRIMPTRVVGKVTARAWPGENGVAFDVVNTPFPEGYATMGKPYLARLYEREKADLRFDYTENGIGRLVPRRGVVAALVIHAEPETVVSLVVDALSEADRSNLDSVARESGGGQGRGYRSFEELLNEIGKDLGETHLLIVHRPSVFETADFGTPEDLTDRWQPRAQVSISLVSAVKDSAAPDKVVDKITQNLRSFGLQPVKDEQGNPLPLAHASGKFLVADPIVNPDEWSLVHPAYGAVKEGGRYFVFTSAVENMEAILRAAEDPQARLIAEPTVQAAAQRLPEEGTMSLLLRGGGVRDMLADQVRLAFAASIEWKIMELGAEWEQQEKQAGVVDPDELERRLAVRSERYRVQEYPDFRDTYRRKVSMAAAIDTVVAGVALGRGPQKQVHLQGYALLRPGVGGATAGE